MRQNIKIAYENTNKNNIFCLSHSLLADVIYGRFFKRSENSTELPRKLIVIKLFHSGNRHKIPGTLDRVSLMSQKKYIEFC